MAQDAQEACHPIQRRRKGSVAWTGATNPVLRAWQFFCVAYPHPVPRPATLGQRSLGAVDLRGKRRLLPDGAIQQLVHRRTQPDNPDSWARANSARRFRSTLASGASSKVAFQGKRMCARSRSREPLAHRSRRFHQARTVRSCQTVASCYSFRSAFRGRRGQVLLIQHERCNRSTEELHECTTDPGFRPLVASRVWCRLTNGPPRERNSAYAR